MRIAMGMRTEPEPALELKGLAESSIDDAARIREILFPSDLSPASERAFDHAALLAERLGAHLAVYHVVVSPPETAATRAADPHREARKRALRDARERLEQQTARSRIAPELLVDEDASIHAALVRTLRAYRPDLTVMSTHGREWLTQLFTGSIAETALDAGRRPLLLVREPEHGVALPYRRILVPTDFSPASGRAFPIAAMLARTFGAEVLPLHVAPPPRGDGYFGTSGVVYELDANVPSEDALARFMGPEFRGLKLTPRVALGSSWDVILETARMERADLIVMSTHGRDSLRDQVLGSHTERVMRQSPCPVLVV